MTLELSGAYAGRDQHPDSARTTRRHSGVRHVRDVVSHPAINFEAKSKVSSNPNDSYSTMSPQIPTSQKVAILNHGSTKVQVQDHPVKCPDDLAPGECLVKMHCSGVCHTDLHASHGDWPVKPVSPLIGGHEGVGEVVAIGKNTIDSPVKIGQRVGIKWVADSCFHCEQCRKGYEQSKYLV